MQENKEKRQIAVLTLSKNYKLNKVPAEIPSAASCGYKL